jgi:hypothetical protein
MPQLRSLFYKTLSSRMIVSIGKCAWGWRRRQFSDLHVASLDDPCMRLMTECMLKYSCGNQ